MSRDRGRPRRARPDRAAVRRRARRSRRCASTRRSTRRSTATRTRVHHDVNLGIAVSLGEDGLIVPVVHGAHELSVEGLAARIKDLARRARARELDAGRRDRRHVHDHQPGPVRFDHGHADHQPAAGGDPRPRGDRQAAGRRHRRGRQRLDRDPADDDPRAELGSPCPRRRALGAVPGDASSGTSRDAAA